MAKSKSKLPTRNAQSRTKKSKNLIDLNRSFSKKRLVIFGLCFAVIGAIFLYKSFAATHTLTPLATQVTAGEGSGMVASRQYPGVFWWLRDGGTATAQKPRDAIYAVKYDTNGKIQPVRGSDPFPFFMVNGAKNGNWEDIALDDQNNLWIGDIGANLCGRTDQKLIKVKEPNPNSTESLSILASYTFRFPDPASGCATWNSEAMFWLDGKMYIFAKTSNSPIYRVDLPSGTSGTAVLTRLGTLAGGVSNISVASISDDRTSLVVASHGKMYVYQTTKPTLSGDGLIRDLIARAPLYNAAFSCACTGKPSVEGGSFARNSLSLAFVAEGKALYYAVPENYGMPVKPVDATAPEISIISPTANSEIKDVAVIEVKATDNVAVSRVDLFYDGTGVIREGTAMGKYGWGSAFDTKRVADGIHTITVVAYDAAGNKSTANIPVVVRNTPLDTTAPAINITSPAENDIVSGIITIGVDASDNVGVSRVDIFYDGTGVIREGTAQGAYGWGSRFDTRKVSNGTHTINVVAYDAANNQQVISKTIQVNN